MKTPQEVQVWHILPALRKELAIGLRKKGLKQKKIASILGLSESAVSQYLKNKRGDGLVFSEEISKEIKTAVDNIGNDNSSSRLEIQHVLKKIKSSKFICDVCHTHLNTDDSCDVCYV